MTTETQTFSPPHLPTEWVMVPKEPTTEMIEAAWGSGFEGERRHIIQDWKAMLSAAPAPPVTTREAEDLVHSQLPVQAASQPAVTQAWMPIETAQKDGTFVLLFCANGEAWCPTIGKWNDGATHPNGYRLPTGWGDETDTFHLPGLNEPTHWMPLPLPPDDRTNDGVAQDSCLKQTLIDSAVSTAIERCAKWHDNQAEILHVSAEKQLTADRRYELQVRAMEHTMSAAEIRALSPVRGTDNE